MFERLTESSRAVLVDAQDLALEMGSPYLETGHLLYGCAEVREETAGRPLHEHGITGTSIRRWLPRAHEQTAGDIDLDALGPSASTTTRSVPGSTTSSGLAHSRPLPTGAAASPAPASHPSRRGRNAPFPSRCKSPRNSITTASRRGICYWGCFEWTTNS
jgi:hypothetical protein